MRNNGYFIEEELARNLNGKKVRYLDDFSYWLINFIFKSCDDEVVKCCIYDNNMKPDIFIEVAGKRANISIKSGHSKYFHCEHIDSFIRFLKENGISKKTIKTILLFQYGDGTIDGTGTKRYGFNELIYILKNELKAANKELNSSNLIEKTITRTMTLGKDITKPMVDYFFHGDSQYGIIVSRKELLNYVLTNNYDYYYTLHIGPIIIAPYLRDINRQSKNEYKRDLVKFTYCNFDSDLEKIISKR